MDLSSFAILQINTYTSSVMTLWVCVCVYVCVCMSMMYVYVCGLKYKRADICSWFFPGKKNKNNEIAIILITHAVNSLFYGDSILQQKWSHMRVGLKRGRCCGCKYSFAKCKINTKINNDITKQIGSLNSLVCLIIKEILLAFTQSMLECFNCIYEKTELISENYKANMSWPMCTKK